MEWLKKACEKLSHRTTAQAVLLTGSLGVVILMGLPTAGDAGVRKPEEEVWLRGQGPYRGQVVDALTKQPIAGAVVVAVWRYEISVIVDWKMLLHDALEVLTDAQGYFVLSAPEIERRAPRHTWFPTFTVFKPGYRYFQGWFASEEAMADRRNRPLLGVVELKPISDRKERLKSWRELEALQPAEEEAKVPFLMKALGEERKALGLGNSE